ncbi:MAG: metal-sensitive transcriptional regulator [Fimbriimonas sp.]
MNRAERNQSASPQSGSASSLDRRLALIEGQVTGVRKMAAANRNCVEIINQIAAIRGGLSQVAIELLLHHMEECASGGGCRTDGEGVSGGEAAMDDLRTSVNRLLK